MERSAKVEAEILTIVASMVYAAELELAEKHQLTLDEDGRDMVYGYTSNFVNRVFDALIRALAYGEVPEETK